LTSRSKAGCAENSKRRYASSILSRYIILFNYCQNAHIIKIESSERPRLTCEVFRFCIIALHVVTLILLHGGYSVIVCYVTAAAQVKLVVKCVIGAHDRSGIIGVSVNQKY
jgi:hypothetical protein